MPPGASGARFSHKQRERAESRVILAHLAQYDSGVKCDDRRPEQACEASSPAGRGEACRDCAWDRHEGDVVKCDTPYRRPAEPLTLLCSVIAKVTIARVTGEIQYGCHGFSIIWFS